MGASSDIADSIACAAPWGGARRSVPAPRSAWNAEGPAGDFRSASRRPPPGAIDFVWNREMISRAYATRLVAARTGGGAVRTIAFVV